MVLRDDHGISLEGTRINKLRRDLSAHLLQGKCLGHLESSKKIQGETKGGHEGWHGELDITRHAAQSV